MSRSFVQGPLYRLGKAQQISLATSSTQGTAFGAQTFAVRLALLGVSATTQVVYRIGDGSQTSTLSTDSALPDHWVETVLVSPSQNIAVIANTAGGTLSVTELVQ